MKQMGILIKGGVAGHPDYNNDVVISWTRTSSPYPQMTAVNGDAWDIRNTWTTPADGAIIGRMGYSRISVNGRFVNQGQNDYNGEGYIPVLKGDVIGNDQTNESNRLFFYPYL